MSKAAAAGKEFARASRQTSSALLRNERVRRRSVQCRQAAHGTRCSWSSCGTGTTRRRRSWRSLLRKSLRCDPGSMPEPWSSPTSWRSQTSDSRANEHAEAAWHTRRDQNPTPARRFVLLARCRPWQERFRTRQRPDRHSVSSIFKELLPRGVRRAPGPFLPSLKARAWGSG